MQRTPTILLLAAVLLACSSCVFSIGGGKKCTHPPECTSCPVAAASSTCVEIDAAGQLGTEASRLAIYKALAQRPNLTSTERAHLVQAVTDNLSTEENRAEVLLLLANNEG